MGLSSYIIVNVSAELFFYTFTVVTGIINLKMSEYKKVTLSTNYTSQRNAISGDPSQAYNSSYERHENSHTYIPGPNIKQASSRIIEAGEGGQGESRYTVTSQRRNINGEVTSNVRTTLEWDGQKRTVISGETDFSSLKHAKDLLLSLLGEFNGKSKVVFQGDYKEDFSKRLLLLEHELEGTMRRVLNLNQADPAGGKRSLDYSKILTEKENALIDKERKIANYEERLRAAQARVLTLENQIQNLTAVINQRNSQIQELRRQLEIKSTAIDKIRGQPNFANSQEIRDILKFIRQEEEGSAQNSAIKGHVSQLERELAKLKSKECSLQDLEAGVESWILGLPNQSSLRNKLSTGEVRLREDERYRSMEEKFSITADLYRQQIERLQRDNPNIRITTDSQIISLLKDSTTKVNLSSGVVQVEKVVTKEIVVQDTRTKYIINALAAHLKLLHKKYPKLVQEMDERLSELMIQIGEVVEFDGMDRIVDIVRYVPQVVKVENVYSYNSEKTRRVEFHLRVLIKALLEEMERIKREKGIVLEIDQGVIGMINAEIMGIVEVDDILKVFRSVPKVVEVPMVVEKVVDNIVRIPEKYTLSNLQTEAIPLQKPQMAVDEKALIVQAFTPVPLYSEKPVSMLEHTEKVVSYPQVSERVAVQVHEKTKVQSQQMQVQKIVEVEKPVMVEVQKIVIQKQLEPVEIIKEVVRYIETEKEVIKPVQVIVEKIVEKLVTVEKPVAVPQIIEKIVEVVRYEKAPEMVPLIETRIQVVKQIVEKIVPLIQIEQRIVTVPQIVEKIVTVEKVVQLPPKQIEVIKEVLRVVRELQVVQVQVPKIIYETRAEIREVQKFVEVPVIVSTVRVEEEIHQVPFIETVNIEKHIPVEIQKTVVLEKETPVEVIKNVPFIMREEVPVLVREEKIVPQEMYYEKIKEVPTTKEKIIEKIVEVPKCVEIEKIVEKIVVVPRIIERIVQVPQIIQKIVQKIIQVPIQMPPVQTFVPQNLYIDRPVEIQVDRLVYLNVDRPVEVPADQVLVRDVQTRTNIQVEKVIEERVVVQREEVPVTIHVDKIVTVPIEVKEVEFVDRVIFKPIEVPVPVELKQTVPVYINTETVQVQPVTQVVEKIVERTVVKPEPQIINQVEERVHVEQKFDVVEAVKPYIEYKIQEVERIEEKIVAVQTSVDQIKEVPYYIEKLVPLIQEIPKIYEFEKEPKVVFTPPTVEIVDRIVPKIINVNKYIQKIVDRLIEVPHLIREIQVVKQMRDRNIPGPESTKTNIKTVDLTVEKELIREKEKILETKVSFIEQTLKTVTEVMENQRDPVIITQDRIIEVPYVLEKMVEKVVVMPQVVEVLKYVYELFGEDQQVNLGLDVNVDVNIQVQEYKKLGEDLEKGFSEFIAELGKIKAMQPSAAQRITLIEQYLAKFRRFIKFPKIHEIIKEKIVQKDKIVRVPQEKSPSEVRQDLAKVLLIEKLVAEISRIKRTHPEISLQLEEDINFIFRLNFEGKVRDVNSRLNSQLKEFENSLDKKFSKMGGWSRDHQIMLKSFLEERFVLANIVKNANEEIKTARKENEQLATENAGMKAMLDMVFKALLENKEMMPAIHASLSRDRADTSLATAYGLLLHRFDQVIDRFNAYQREDFEPTRYLGRKFIEEIIGSSLREKEKQIEILKAQLRSSRVRDSDHVQCNIIIDKLQADINKLTQQLNDSSLRGKGTRELQLEIDRLNRIIKETSTSSTSKTNDVRNLEAEISRLKITIQQQQKSVADHSSCQSIQRGLEAENRSLKIEIESLLLKLKNAEKELLLLRSQSPKKTVITSVGGREEGKNSIVISHLDRESEEYGENYQEYMHGDVNIGGTVEYQGYHSGIMEAPRDLANSAATYRSGQVITSSQFVRTPTNVQSTRYLGDREGTQQSVTTAGMSAVKKYNYYEKKYEKGNT